jgi:hypothetical protein
MKVIDQILETYPEEDFFIADGFDDAIIGFDEGERRLVYDIDEIINILILEGMTYEDAIEHYDYNIAGSYVGEGTPIYIRIFK